MEVLTKPSRTLPGDAVQEPGKGVVFSGWLQKEIERLNRTAEATKILLDMPEANLDTSDPDSLLFEDNETKL